MFQGMCAEAGVLHKKKSEERRRKEKKKKKRLRVSESTQHFFFRHKFKPLQAIY
jgi:hypothetical protein